MEKKFKETVFIGRFQPLHHAHLEIIQHGLEISDKLLILIGSAKSARSSKNPFSYEERAVMIYDCLTKAEREKVIVRPLEDDLYNDEMWRVRVKTLIDENLSSFREIGLLGTPKDSSTASYIMSIGENLVFEPVDTKSNINATLVRKTIYENPLAIFTTWRDKKIDSSWKRMVPKGVSNFITMKYIDSKDHDNFKAEMKHIADYKNQWSSAPYPPSFYCCDYVLNMSNHILLVVRGMNPGKGNLALPGGFVRQDESARYAAVRELKEETQIKLPFAYLDSIIKNQKVFDHPDRSLRGRTITNAFYAEVSKEVIPEVVGADDAEQAFWLPINEVYSRRDEFHDDHFHIINYFINQK